jgi:ACS family glucarate transporter-like MFS transporter
MSEITGSLQEAAPARTQATARRTNVRYLVLLLIFVATTFNYVDRATLSIAAPGMRSELGFDAITMGLAFSAFGWAYTGLQIPGGWLLDRFGARLIYGIGLLLWSVFTFLQGFVGLVPYAFLTLFALRFLMGVAESPAFPANSRLTVMWFPARERGFATAIFSSAQYFALAAFTPLMTWTLHGFGWHFIFFWTGAAGVVIGLFWLYWVREPRQHGRVNQAELDFIEAGGGLPNMGDRQSAVKWSDIKALICNRMLIGVYIGQFCLTTITWFFLTWFPTYLIQAKGMSMLQVGVVAAIPAIFGFIGGMAGGACSDLLLRRGHSLTVARKLPIIAGLLLSSTIVLANYVASDALIIAVISIAFFAKGFGNIGWCVLGDVSPKEIMGISGGVFNFCGNIASIVTPIVIGIIVQEMGSFELALLYVGAMSLIGAFAYIVIVGPLKRLELGERADGSRLA